MTHLTPEQLEALLLDESIPPDDPRLRHLAVCPECARRLAREARVEEAIHDAVASNDRPDLRVPSVARRASPWRHALAAAAALAVLVAAARLLTPPATRESGSQASAPAIPLSPDTPCLVDPLAVGPGRHVVAPTEICRGVTSPALSRTPVLSL